MTIYLVLDEKNSPIGEYSSYQKAMNYAEEMTLWEEDHYYHVVPLELENAASV